MIKREIVENVVNDPFTAKVVAAGTTSSGIMTILDLIPDGVGKLATLIGIILSILLIFVHINNLKKIRIETKLRQLELDEKMAELAKEGAPSA